MSWGDSEKKQKQRGKAKKSPYRTDSFKGEKKEFGGKKKSEMTKSGTEEERNRRTGGRQTTVGGVCKRAEDAWMKTSRKSDKGRKQQKAQEQNKV